MKINVTTPLLTYAGKAIRRMEDGKDVGPFTVRDAIASSLNTLDEKKMSREEMARIFQISVKTFSVSEVEYTDKELDFIINKGLTALSPVSLGRLTEIFTGKEQIVPVEPIVEEVNVDAKLGNINGNVEPEELKEDEVVS